MAHRAGTYYTYHFTARVKEAEGAGSRRCKMGAEIKMEIFRNVQQRHKPVASVRFLNMRGQN